MGLPTHGFEHMNQHMNEQDSERGNQFTIDYTLNVLYTIKRTTLEYLVHVSPNSKYDLFNIQCLFNIKYDKRGFSNLEFTKETRQLLFSVMSGNLCCGKATTQREGL